MADFKKNSNHNGRPTGFTREQLINMKCAPMGSNSNGTPIYLDKRTGDVYREAPHQDRISPKSRIYERTAG